MPLPPVSHDLNTKDGKLQISGEAVHSSVSAMHKTVAKVKKKKQYWYKGLFETFLEEDNFNNMNSADLLEEE